MTSARKHNHDPMLRTFGEVLKDVRRRHGLTQEDLAARLGYKGTTAISLWERPGAPVPEPKTIRKLAEAINCAPADLLAGVLTPYDELRGEVATGRPAVGLTTEQRRLLAAWDRLPPPMRKAHLLLIETQGARLKGR